MRAGVLFIMCIFPYFLDAQKKCGTIAPSTGEFENWISSKIETKKFQFSGKTREESSMVYRIPVVVHIIHKGEPIGTGVNLSDGQITIQINSVNADFRRLNADIVNTPIDFLPVATDTKIEFVLARQDPHGKPTNGIVRIQGEKSIYKTTDGILLRSESYWPPENYLNIYVLDLHRYFGYTSYPTTDLEGIPNTITDFIHDAVYIDYEYFGIDTEMVVSANRGRTLTHEIGHFLGLIHIWGDDDCSGDDFVEDTPTAQHSHDRVTLPCTYPIPDNPNTRSINEGNTCTTEDNPDLPDMFQNYMDYTDDVCMNLFTKGQKTRMRTVLENAPRRNSLLRSPALLNPMRFPDDLAATRILSPGFAVCDNPITPMLIATNYGTNEITTYDVHFFINGNPIPPVVTVTNCLPPLSSDTVILPHQIIETVSSNISFEIANINGTTDGNLSNNTISKMISFTPGINILFSENFEGMNKFLGSFGPFVPWEVVTAPNETMDNQALVFKAFQNNRSFGETTIIETPLSPYLRITGATLSFSYAYSGIPNGVHDGLVIKASTDCGTTYPDVLFAITGPELQTVPSLRSKYVPTNHLDWMDTTLGISAYHNREQLRFKFIGLNGGGNNIYLDNIQIRETNILENDIRLQSISGPLVTCNEDVDLSLQIRNEGSQTITRFGLEYEVNGRNFLQSFEETNISERGYETFILDVTSLTQNENRITVNVTEVNAVMDLSEIGNSIVSTINRSLVSDEYPLTVDFESMDNWINISHDGSSSLWERTAILANGVLRVNSFDETRLGTESWFISPVLTTGGLESAVLYFRTSYAPRTGSNDRLRVLASINCGQNYPITLLEADADSLAVIREYNDKWVPTTDNEWKEFQLDLSNTIHFRDEIRIAFVFNNGNGNGNDLYIDDINIRGNELPFRVFPNPTHLVFNLVFNLAQKDKVKVEMMDISGKIMMQQYIPNAFDQIIPFEAPLQSGLYFIRVSGSNFVATQKLFINN